MAQADRLDTKTGSFAAFIARTGWTLLML